MADMVEVLQEIMVVDIHHIIQKEEQYQQGVQQEDILIMEQQELLELVEMHIMIQVHIIDLVEAGGGWYGDRRRRL